MAKRRDTQGMVQRRPGGFASALVWALVVHVGLVLVGVISSAVASAPKTLSTPATTVKLVKLGKKRDANLLPRLSGPPPPAPGPKAPPKLDQAPKAPTEKVAAKTPEIKKEPEGPSAADALQRLKQSTAAASALERLRQDLPYEEPEGEEDGDPAGDALVQSLGDKFATEIYRCMKANWHVEGVVSESIRGQSAKVVIRVGPDGTFISHEIVEQSDVPAVNRGVENAVKRCGKVSPPHKRLRDSVRKDGVVVIFKV